MHSTYNSEMLGRSRKFGDVSYFNTPSNADHNSKEATMKENTGTIMMTSPTHYNDDTLNHRHGEERKSTPTDDDANTTDEEKDRYSTLVRELNRLDRKGDK